MKGYRFFLSSPQYKLTSIISRQIIQIRICITTLELRRISLLRHNPRLQSFLPTPMHRRLSLPRPVEPAPALLKRRDLRLRIRLQERLVRVRVIGRILVGLFAAAGWVVGLFAVRMCRAVRLKDCAPFAFDVVVVSFPAGTDADVCEVFGAVGVGLGPFTA